MLLYIFECVLMFCFSFLVVFSLSLKIFYSIRVLFVYIKLDKFVSIIFIRSNIISRMNLFKRIFVVFLVNIFDYFSEGGGSNRNFFEVFIELLE